MKFSYLFLTAIVCGLLVHSANASIIWSGNWDKPPTSDHFPDFDIDQNGTDDFYIGFGTQGWIFNTFHENYGISGIVEPSPLEVGVTINELTSGIIMQGESSIILTPVGGGIEGDSYFDGIFAYTNGYLGLAFEVDGATHYGWISISHSTNRPAPLNGLPVVHSWAWESNPDTPIVTGAIPEPSSGALVIVGALSLWQLRRTRQRKGINFR